MEYLPKIGREPWVLLVSIPTNPFPLPRITPEEVEISLLKAGYKWPQVQDVIERLKDLPKK
jgi:hypothetical protein